MDIITGFEEQFSDIQKEKSYSSQEEKNCGEYALVFTALSHNNEVAENVFARLSKKQFRSAVDHKIQKKDRESAKGLWPFWYAEAAIVVDVENIDSGMAGGLLKDLVAQFGEHILSSIKENMVLVESLMTTIIRVGETLYQFRLKQKWAQDGQ